MNLVGPHIASLFGLHLPPSLALLLTVAFIIFLFRRDIRERPNVSGALWLPLIWLVLGCSRALTAWLNIFGVHVSAPASVEEGSPLDAWFFFVLIAAGIFVLNRRQVRFSEVVRNNGWLIVFLLYCLISIAWSDFPFVAFKRWIKILGHPIMALIVLTEPDPKEALIRLMKRCAYVVVPVSILFIKFYPQLGRAWDSWGGFGMNTGITRNKNALGADCMIVGFFFFWYLLQIRPLERGKARRDELWLIAGFLIAICYLFRLAHSATSFISFVIGALMVGFLGIRSINKNLIGTYMLAAVVILAVAELAFGISGDLSEALGRGTGLTGRTRIWARLLELHTNPILGTGFESFWLGDRPELLEGIFVDVSGKTVLAINEAHNGYLEIYLTLGAIGLSLLIGLFVATFRKIRLELFRDFESARYRLGFLTAVMLYNWTEAPFRTVSPVWFVFYLIAMDYPRAYLTSAQPSVGVAGSKEEMEFAHTEGEP